MIPFEIQYFTSSKKRINDFLKSFMAEFIVNISVSLSTSGDFYENGTMHMFGTVVFCRMINWGQSALGTEEQEGLGGCHAV